MIEQTTTVPLLPIRTLSIEIEPRVESGPVQFGDDWPGVFWRGDNAAHQATLLRTVANRCRNGLATTQDADMLERFARDFDQSNLMLR